MDATEAAVHFARALTAARVPHAIGGAIAYGFFGVARGTLIAAGLRIDRSASLASAGERGDARSRFEDLPVDLFFNSIAVHDRAATRIREVTLRGTKLRVLSPEDTAVFKVLFYRGKDLVDSSACWASRAPTSLTRIVLAALVEVVGEDDYRTRKWDELVRALVLA